MLGEGSGAHSRFPRSQRLGNVSAHASVGFGRSVFTKMVGLIRNERSPQPLLRYVNEDCAAIRFGRGSGGVRVRFRVRFQPVKVPIFGGFPVENPSNKATASKLF